LHFFFTDGWEILAALEWLAYWHMWHVCDSDLTECHVSINEYLMRVKTEDGFKYYFLFDQIFAISFDYSDHKVIRMQFDKNLVAGIMSNNRSWLFRRLEKFCDPWIQVYDFRRWRSRTFKLFTEVSIGDKNCLLICCDVGILWHIYTQADCIIRLFL
jgi:hypothetical protein